MRKCPIMTTHRIKVGFVADLPPGQRKLIPTDLENILVLNVAGQFLAISNTCPHAGGYLSYGPLTGYTIECPLHYWPFDVRTGLLVEMEGSGLDERLNTYPVVVEGDEIFIEMQSA